jgi:hypothetical protein
VATGNGGDDPLGQQGRWPVGQQETTVGLTTTAVAKIMFRSLFASVDLNLEKKNSRLRSFFVTSRDFRTEQNTKPLHFLVFVRTKH